MHQIKTSIREIVPGELPTITTPGRPPRQMNAQELLNIGIVALGNNLYSCVHQEQRDPDSLVWQPKEGQALPGRVVSEGVILDRHASLPADLRSRVMRARVIRSKAGSAKDIVSENLAELGAVLDANVGDVDGAPLIDTSSPEATVLEAQRLAGSPNSDLEQQLVPMGDVTAGDVVEADSLIPHSWAGEPRR